MTQPPAESQSRMTVETAVNERLEALELRLTFMDDHLERLNAVLVEQGRQLRDQQDQLRLLYQQWQQVQGGDSTIEAFDPQQNVPPHY